MNMKIPDKKIIFQGAIFLALIICCALQCVNLLYTKQLTSSIEEQQSQSCSIYTTDAPMIAGDAIYRLYACGGKIGIYDAKTEVLIDIIDVLVTTLPAADRLALKKGIEIYTFADLAQIIEDFST